MTDRTLLSALCALLAVCLVPISLAGDPPASCTEAGCPITSDLVVFAEGDSSYEIVARIEDCTWCSPPDGDGNFQIDARAVFEFGPYTNPACNGADDLVRIELASEWFREGAGSGGEATYVPKDGSIEFPALQEALLRTQCVDGTWLDYRIPHVVFTGDDGAWAGEEGSALLTELRPPTSVRASEGRRVVIPRHRLTGGMNLLVSETKSASEQFSYWPEGMPFRLGAWHITYREDRVSFDTGSPPAAPPGYSISRPDGSSLEPFQIIGCEDPETQGGPCDWEIWNAGYFDSPDWVPHESFFDVTGMDLRLELPPGTTIRYQPLFPRGTWLSLGGPATVNIVDSRVSAGDTFQDGRAWVRTREFGACQDSEYARGFILDVFPERPTITADGGIIAGVTDLNPDEGGGPEPLTWTVHSLENLGCGTFWMPPPWSPVHEGGTAFRGPQKEWLRSARADDLPGVLSDPSTDERGIYAGFNYNRNRACVGGDNDGVLCGAPEDCPGGDCVADLWSPFCPEQAATPAPTWTVEFQKPNPPPPGYAPLVFEVESTDAEKEMAFYLRRSGITGVFDAGPVDVSVGEESDDEFTLNFNAFGHGFLASHSEWSDTIIRGGLDLPWPSDTIIPFGDMTMCDCGAAKSASTGEPPTENWLEHWSARFYPHQIRFSPDPVDPDPQVGVDCDDPVSTACDEAPCSAKSICIDASTPIPHFSPDADASWSIGPDGRPGDIVPLKDPEYEFEPAHAEPFPYHVERFALSEHTTQTPSDPFGFYAGEGQLAVPYFGLPDAGLRVRRDRAISHMRVYDADLHEKGNMADPLPVGDSHVFWERKIAADRIRLAYKVDYAPAAETADPDDDAGGRGLLFGYAWDDDLPGADPNLDVGSIKVPSAIVMTPSTILADIGPAGATRLWGATLEEGRNRLQNEILPADLFSWGDTYEDAIARFPEDPFRPWALPYPDAWYVEEQHLRGVIPLFTFHPDYARPYRTGHDPADPGMNARGLSGFLHFSSDLEMVDLAYVDADVDTNGQFFAFKRSNLTVDRHIKTASPEQPITQMGRKSQPDNMALPGNMNVPFPDFPGLQWDFDFDYSVPPPEFKSLTGTLDLTQGGLSGIGFDKAGMTLKYWADGDWYFQAGLKLNFNGYGAYGDILLGNTKTMAPLQALDPVVTDFLSGVTSFKGGYARVGVSGRIFDYGCLFRVSAGIEVGGWYITDSYGGKLRGWVSGRGACIVSVRGDVTLLGGEVGDRFKLSGHMWVAGGIGFCDEEDWDTPDDVFDDDGCAACVLSGTVTGITPPKFKLSMDGPDVDCTLF